MNDMIEISPAPPEQSGCVKITIGCLGLAGLLSLIVVGSIAFILVSGTMTMGNVLGSIGDFFNVEPASASVVPSRTIISSIAPLGQLVTVSAEVAQADINVTVDTGGLNLCGHNANHVAQGVVEAGIDMTLVGDENISYDAIEDRYTINLPAPQITSCRIEYIRQYERQGGGVGCNVDWDSIRLLAQYQATIGFATDTLEADILDRAERETTLLMGSFIAALTDSDVDINYADNSEINLPPSCQPQLPRGWTLDPETQLWIEN